MPLEPSTDASSSHVDSPAPSQTEFLPSASSVPQGVSPTSAPDAPSVPVADVPSSEYNKPGLPPLAPILGQVTQGAAQLTTHSTLSSHSTVFGSISTTVSTQLTSQSALSTVIPTSAPSAPALHPSVSTTTETTVVVATAASSQTFPPSQSPQRPPSVQTSSVDDFGVKTTSASDIAPSPPTDSVSVQPTQIVTPPPPSETGGIGPETGNDTLAGTGLPEEAFFSENGTLLISDYTKSTNMLSSTHIPYIYAEYLLMFKYNFFSLWTTVLSNFTNCWWERSNLWKMAVAGKRYSPQIT